MIVSSSQKGSLLTSKQQDELLSMTREKMQKMHEDKKQTPSLIIPKNLIIFIKTDQYKNFLFSIFQYCNQYNQLMLRYNELKQKMKSRVNNDAVFLQKQKQNLNQMQKQLSYQYASILLMSSSSSSHSQKDQKEQFFFQTLIYLISKVLKQFFNRQQFSLIEEQINRLFRTNRFNIIKRRHQKDSIMKQFPVLKDGSNKQKINLQTIINKAPEQIIAYRQLQREMRKRAKSNSGSGYTTLTGVQQGRDDHQRSPLICTWLPSRKNMLQQFNNPNYAKHLKVSSNNNNRTANMTLHSGYQNEEALY